MGKKECEGEECKHFSVEPDEKPDGTILGYPECAKHHEIEEHETGEYCDDFEKKGGGG